MLAAACALAALVLGGGRADAVEGLDLTSRVAVTIPRVTFNRSLNLYQTTAVIRNVSATPLFAPLSLIVTGLNATAVTLVNASGKTPSGEPYASVGTQMPGVQGGRLAPGATASVTLWFASPSGPGFTFGRALFGFLQPPTSAPKPPSVDVALAQRSARELEATWRALGLGGRRRAVQLLLHAPGPEAPSAGLRWLSPGLPPPNGPVSYRTPAGAWQSAPVVYANHAQPGRARFRLPDGPDGAWAVEVRVIEPGTGAELASGRQTALVSREPGVFLRLSRPIAGSLEDMRATLLTTAGFTPRPVRLAAWLVTPDGRRLGLPGRVENELILYEAPSRSEEIVLLHGLMGPEGLGAYQVHVRLFDAATRALLGRASAGFEVCDTPGRLTGVVRNAAGGLLGAGATLAEVRALDVDDAAVTATSPIDAAGAYALTLAPGRYLIRATVMDEAGVHRAESAGLVEVGCGGAAATLDLTASPPSRGLARVASVQ